MLAHNLTSWVLLGIGLLGPGWLLNRVLGTTAGPLGAFLGSAAILFNLVLALDAVGVSLTRLNLAIGLAAISGGLWIVSQRRHPSKTSATAATAPNTASSRRPRLQAYHGWLVAPLIALTGIVLKTIADPLFGYDTIFRWDFLARQMVQEGSLHFYPAHRAADFLVYGWPDGIAPLVSSLYLWSYASLGSLQQAATTPVVLAQVGLLFWAVYEFAARRAGPIAGVAASALLATSSLALWGVSMGQETGLTALALVAMFLFLERQKTEPASAWCLWAGLAAGVGALAREYGVVFAGLGLLALTRTTATGRDRWTFLGAFTLVAAPWYVRNVLRTGNPLWPHHFGGLLPGNEVHADYMRVVSELWGASSSAWPPVTAFGTAILLSLLPIAFAIVSLGRNPTRSTLPLVIAGLTMVALWLWSISSTSAGPLYALRILTPAIALGAVLGASDWKSWAHGWRAGLIAALLLLGAVDAVFRFLFLPSQPGITWWNAPAGAWLQSRAAAERWNNDPNWDVIAASAQGTSVLVAEPFSHAALVKRGTSTIPLFSPAVGFLFTPDQRLPDGLARLRALGVRFILLSSDNSINAHQLPRYAFFHALLATEPIVRMPSSILYDLYAPPTSNPSPAANGPTKENQP